jgi:hypothetical protein
MTMGSGNTSLRSAIIASLNPHLQYISAIKKPIGQTEIVVERHLRQNKSQNTNKSGGRDERHTAEPV